MKYLLVFIAFTLSNSVFSNIQEESKAYVKTLKNREVEGHIGQNSDFKECQENASNIKDTEQKNATIRECFEKKLEEKDDNEIVELGKKLDLQAFDFKESKTATGMRKYLSQRLKATITNIDPDKNRKFHDRKKAKFVGQDKFLEIYNTQLGKNVLMEISQYCLENLRIKKNGKADFIEMDCGVKKPCKVESTKAKNNENIETVLGIKGAHSNMMTFYKEQAVEVNYDPKSDNKLSEKIRNFSMKEFQKGPDYLRAKYQFCASSIKIMCKKYECSTTLKYDAKESENKEKKLCPKLVSNWKSKKASRVKENSIESKLQNIDDSKIHGAIACNLMGRLRDYRKTIAATNETQKMFSKMKGKNNGFNVSSAYGGGVYSGQGNGNEKSIDEITNIASHEVTDNKDIKNLDGLQDKAKELKEKCKGNDIETLEQDCKEYIAKEKEFKDVELQFEAATAVELRKIQALKNDEEKLKEYLAINGLKSIQNMDKEMLVQTIQDKYKAQRLAIINKLRDKYDVAQKDKIKNLKKKQDQTNIKGQIETASAEIRDKKDRIGNIIHYNNVITSFLEVENEEGERSTNQTALNVEREGFDKYGKESKYAESEEKYFEDLGGEEYSNDNTGRTSVGMTVIDAILGNNEEETTK